MGAGGGGCLTRPDPPCPAYGTDFVSVAQIKIGATCRIAKLFLSDAPYSDAEMPPHLRVLLPEKVAGKPEYALP